MDKQYQADVYLQAILCGFCNKPEQIKITKRVDESGLTLLIDADPTDIPYIIGQKGSVINSIRKLMDLFGKKYNCKVNIFLPRKEVL